MSLSWDVSGIVSMIDWDYVFLGSRPQWECIIIIMLYQVYILSAWLISVDVYLDGLAEIVFGRFIHFKVTLFPLFNIVLFKGSHYVQATLKQWEFIFPLLEDSSIYINILNFSCIGDLSKIFNLFIKSLVYISTDSQIFILYFR